MRHVPCRTRLVVVSLLVASLPVATTGCLKPMDGTLTVLQPVTLAGGSRPIQLQDGRYPVRITSKDDGVVTLRIERRPGDTVKVKLPAGEATGASGERWVPAVASGHSFDLLYTLAANRSEGLPQVSARPCRVETPELVCHTTTAAEFGTGSTEPREVCTTVRTLRQGTRTTTSVHATDVHTINGRLVDPATGQEFARLYGRSERDRSYSFESTCG